MTKLRHSRSSSKGSTATSSTTATQPGSETPRRRYETRSFWDQWYQKHGEAVEWSGPVNDTVLQAIMDVLKGLPKSEAPLRVCELGCGCSHLAPMLRDAGVAVVGVDFSQEVINANRLRHPDIQWECWDALQLADKFDAGHFDAIVGKTLIDCFLTRTDAAGSIRRMLQQCHTVLKDTGCMMLLDKASSDTIIGRGRTRQLTVDSHKMLTFRILHPQPRQTYSASMPTEDSASNLQRQWELEIEPTLHKHFVVRPAAAGCGSLVVWSTDHVATGAGIETGDLILGYRRSGSKNMTVGNATETAKAIRTSLRNIFLLMERPASGAARRKTASLKTRLMSRQSTSQSDHLRRLQKARILRAGETQPTTPAKDVTLPQLRVKADSFISDYTCAAEGYFV